MARGPHLSHVHTMMFTPLKIAIIARCKSDTPRRALACVRLRGGCPQTNPHGRHRQSTSSRTPISCPAPRHCTSQSRCSPASYVQPAHISRTALVDVVISDTHTYTHARTEVDGLPAQYAAANFRANICFVYRDSPSHHPLPRPIWASRI